MYKMRAKMHNKKGFTLMEMLIVVAIIAILIAIAIPVFSAQLNKARVAADHANMRSAYALMQAAILTEQLDGSDIDYTKNYYLTKDGNLTSVITETDTLYKIQGTEDTCKFPVASVDNHDKDNFIQVEFSAADGEDDLSGTLSLVDTPAHP